MKYTTEDVLIQVHQTFITKVALPEFSEWTLNILRIYQIC